MLSNNQRIINHSNHESKQKIIDYMSYYGIAIVAAPTGYGGDFYQIKHINDKFSIHKIQELTGYSIQCAYGYINLKGRQVMYYRTLDDAFSTLKAIYNLMNNKSLDADF